LFPVHPNIKNQKKTQPVPHTSKWIINKGKTTHL